MVPLAGLQRVIVAFRCQPHLHFALMNFSLPIHLIKTKQNKKTPDVILYSEPDHILSTHCKPNYNHSFLLNISNKWHMSSKTIL